MKKIYSTLTVIFLFFISGNALAQSFLTSGYYTYTVPTGVTNISFDVQGASGGQSSLGVSYGGGGARVQGNLAVTPGQVLHLFVGGKGTDGVSAMVVNNGGYNGGGNGFYMGGGGGGASDIRLSYSSVSSYTTSNRVIVAAGGGGAGYTSGTGGYEKGGGGGALTGESGYYLNTNTTASSPTGGTPSAPGTQGIICASGISASLGQGANATIFSSSASGGGGAGYYGGGWGCGAGGAGGSSYTGAGTSAVIHTRGYNVYTGSGSANGKIILCTGNAGTIIGNAPVCIGSTRTLSSTFGGGTWVSSATGIATVGSSSGLVSGIAAGTATLTYTASVPGCGTAYSTVVVTVNPIPTAITGPATVCATQTITLSNTVSGGVWTSSTPARATANSSSGDITGIAAGITTISYSFSSTCYVTKSITVNALSAISGVSSLCTGLTTTLTNGTSGGTWSSSNASVATIGSTGFVTAIGTGTTTISYTLPSGCTATRLFTVVTTPSAISGSNNICLSATTPLTDGGGGTWSSSAPGIASIGSASGIVTGAAVGTAIITYSLGAGCITTMPFTVNAYPAAISGSAYACVGTPTTFTSSGSGSWSTADATISIGSASGSVTGISTGLAAITYTSTTGCAVTRVVTVSSPPASITGTLSACPAATTLLSCTTLGGTWSSASTAIATISSSGGSLFAVSAGTVDITYSITATSCYRTVQFTVNPNPSPITGSSTICDLATTTLSSTPSGGTWSAFPSSIGSTSGVVSAVYGSTTGVTTVLYTLPTGCRSTFYLTVNPLPVAGTFSVPMTDPCPGDVFTLTTSYSDGVWTSTNTTLATIGATSGLVNVLAGGWDTIKYSRTNSCGTTTYQRTLVIRYGPNAGTISGLDNVCAGATITMTNTATTGTWSTTTSNATISSGGILMGISPGIDTVRYTDVTTCGTQVAKKVVTVNPNPFSSTITGPGSVCEGEIITLACSNPGGVWSTSNSNASIDASGNVTGIAAGAVDISYSLSNVCGSASATLHVIIISSAICRAAVQQLSTATIKVYPNPSKGSFFVELPQPIVGTITVTDVLGRIVESRDIPKTNNLVHSFNLAIQGNYYITVSTSENSYHSKVCIW